MSSATCKNMSQTPEWKNRIIKFEMRAANTFAPNELNARLHPEQQRESLRASLNQVGWIAPVLENQSTGKLLDGHARIEESLARDENAQVPVIVLDVSEEEEKFILLTFDPIAAQAEYDQEILGYLLEATKTAANEDGAEDALRLIESVEKSYAKPEREAQEEEQEQKPLFDNQIMAFREDNIFSSSNLYGIPDLREDMLADTLPVKIWDGKETIDQEQIAEYLFIHGKARLDMPTAGATLAFYVDDYKFESAWNDAVKWVSSLYNKGWGAVVAPDFSVWRDDPLVIQLHNIYRSRWCARYWQEAGLKVIPSLNWSDERSYEFATLGIPRNCKVVSCQVQTTRSSKGKEYFAKGLAENIRQIQPENVILYAGLNQRDWLEPLLANLEASFIWLPSWSDVRRNLIS